MPTLRFDYAGCGNAMPLEDVVDDFSAWVNSTIQAIEHLKAISGVSRVLLVGVRVGAAIACLASLGRTDVLGLALIAPVLKGRAWVRELTALAGASGRPAADGFDGIESGGFAMGGELRRTLEGLDLFTLERSPAPDVLILDRDDLPGSAKWAEHLRCLGAAVERQALPGFHGMVVDPHHAEVPQAMVDAFLHWSQVRVGHVEGELSAFAVRVSQPSTACELQNAREAAVRIPLEAGQALRGVLTEPRDEKPKGVVLMLNAGAIRLVGPSRLYVRLARQWASQGHAVLRIDLAGLGDSAPPPAQAAGQVYSPHAMADVAATLRWLTQRFGPSPVQVMGLCSGAYHAFQAALTGLPVKRAIMINPLTFRWREGMSLDAGAEGALRDAADMSHRRQALRSGEPWRRLLKGEFSARHLSLALRQSLVWWLKAQSTRVTQRLGWLPAGSLAHDLQAIAKRGVPMHFVFAAAEPGLELLHAQAEVVVNQLAAKDALRVQVIQGADHTFTSLAARTELIQVLTDLLTLA